MDQFYFEKKSLNNGNSVVKFGDSRSSSDNTSNYRGEATKHHVHGNANDGHSMGKQLEQHYLQPLVEKGMAKQIGQSESYIVKDSTAASLQAKVSPLQSDSYVTAAQRGQLLNGRVNYKDDRKVHGNVKGDKF